MRTDSFAIARGTPSERPGGSCGSPLATRASMRDAASAACAAESVALPPSVDVANVVRFFALARARRPPPATFAAAFVASASRCDAVSARMASRESRPSPRALLERARGEPRSATATSRSLSVEGRDSWRTTGAASAANVSASSSSASSSPPSSSSASALPN